METQKDVTSLVWIDSNGDFVLIEVYGFFWPSFKFKIEATQKLEYLGEL